MFSEQNTMSDSPLLDTGVRQKGLHIIKPIVYGNPGVSRSQSSYWLNVCEGNVSKYFGKKREEDGHTHQWTVYLKPYKNEDMSAYVKKVNFKLHDSYSNANRTVTKPPYEVTETGWGEFEIVIKVYFQVGSNKTIALTDHLE